ncbi:PREDICTED: HMG1/2-like protein isoform X1 [Theobroma cacao]|uniref:HMG1/2-like protein isoform X1 n=1 Tax=Theobroma cacao TaxID=3641 RepID=A0AB32UMV1_THECC|nr:PREDICTED: HMG1/2-like protein isoform X1 [Theobroma cacao]
MANHPRTRKRVHATIPRRAPDGSAFEKCDVCGDMVAIALADMHECGTEKKELKRFKGIVGTQNVVKPMVPWQPRSAFSIFMESFMIDNNNGNLIDIDRRGFETWKNMCKEERQPYVAQAEKVNSAYTKNVIEEEKNVKEVDDDEADSAMVGKFDQFYEDSEYYGTSDNDEPYQSGGLESLNTTECPMLCSALLSYDLHKAGKCSNQGPPEHSSSS